MSLNAEVFTFSPRDGVLNVVFYLLSFVVTRRKTHELMKIREN